MSPKTLFPLLFAAFAAGSCGYFSSPAPARSSPPPVTPESVAPAPPEYDDISIAAQDRRIPVLMYHDVIDHRGPGSVWFDTTKEEFEQQMQTIESQGMVPISVKDLYDHLTKGKDVPEDAIVITFDDNYQGYYDNAYPILKKYNFPSAMFVHTGFVGDKSGSHPKMSWDTLKELVKDPLVTIGSHTITHPADITQLSPDQQQKEIEESKKTLEANLGVKIDFFAYPDGKNDKITQDLVKDAGYKMAFTMVNGPAEESPNIYAVDRYVQTRLDRAIADRQKSLQGAPGVYKGDLKTGTPVAYQEVEENGVKLALVTGGDPVSVTSDTREGVLDFINRTTGAVAGINGTFFSMAAIHSTDNRLVGPCKTAAMDSVIPDDEPDRWAKLRNRPLILWGPKTIAIAPYIPESMGNDAVFKAFMPDVTDVFLGGAWLIHDGVARSADDMLVYGSKDLMDPRRRALIGVNGQGEIVLAASKQSCTSEQFAAAAAAAGVQEAVLLDSGFSTSLVYGQKIMASGHSTQTEPSRPVPHAILLKGTLDPSSQATADAAIPATTVTGGDPSLTASASPRHRRRKRRRRSAVAAAPDAPAPDLSTPIPPSPDPGLPTGPDPSGPSSN